MHDRLNDNVIKLRSTQLNFLKNLSQKQV